MCKTRSRCTASEAKFKILKTFWDHCLTLYPTKWRKWHWFTGCVVTITLRSLCHPTGASSRRLPLSCPLINESSKRAGRLHTKPASSEGMAGSRMNHRIQTLSRRRGAKMIENQRGRNSRGWMSDDKCISGRWHFRHHLIDHLGDIF